MQDVWFVGLSQREGRWLSRGGGPFLKVSRSCWSGLFHCYEVKDLPRTNNALDQLFGSYRHHERRVSGRKVASPALVIGGAARIIVAVATRQRPERVANLIGANRESWTYLRAEFAERRLRRCERRRFCRAPKATYGNWRPNATSRVCRRSFFRRRCSAGPAFVSQGCRAGNGRSGNAGGCQSSGKTDGRRCGRWPGRGLAQIVGEFLVGLLGPVQPLLGRPLDYEADRVGDLGRVAFGLAWAEGVGAAITEPLVISIKKYARTTYEKNYSG